MNAIAAYASTQGPTFWLVVAAAMLACETISGRAWWIWVAVGAAVAALMTLWLNLSFLLEALAFVAATILGVAYSLRMRFAAARKKQAQRQA